jgi:hypothetical protein
MKQRMSWFSIYVKGNFHVSFSALSLSLLSMQWLNISPPFVVYFFLFISTFLGYSFLKYYSVRDKLLTSSSFFTIFLLLSLLVGCVALVIGLFSLRLPSIVVAAIATVITLFYAKGSPVAFSRENGFVKIVLVGLVWALMCVSFPVAHFGIDLLLSKAVVHLFFAVLLLVLALMVPFEIRDLASDQLHWPTLAQYLGTTRIKAVGFACLLGALVLFSKVTMGGLSTYTAMCTLGSLVSLAIWKSHKNQSQWFASFWVEAIPIAAFAVNYLFK